MIEATDELRERLIAELNGPQHAPLYTHDRNNGECVECPVPLYTLAPEDIADALLSLVVAVVAEARTEGAIAELEAFADTLQSGTDMAYAVRQRAAVLRGVGNQNAEPRWSANRLEEVLRDGLPDQNAEPNSERRLRVLCIWLMRGMSPTIRLLAGTTRPDQP